MSAREAIMARVRAALRTPTDPALRALTTTNNTGSPTFHTCLPAVEADYVSRRNRFAAQAAKLGARFEISRSPDELIAKLKEIARVENWRRIATHRGELAQPVSEALGRDIFFTDAGYDVSGLESCNVGVTECDALIAQTGSVLVTSRSAGGRALSVLPPHHVVLANREQMLGDLSAGYALLQEKYANDYPGFISMITGPSRTGDIEQTIVMGAHGPKKLTIFLIEG